MGMKLWDLRLGPQWAALAIACLIAAIPLRAQAQESLMSLDDTELVGILHRQDALEELQRRLQTYSPERRKALTALLENPHSSKKFPLDYSDDELYAYLRKPADFQAFSRAQDELGRRFLASPPERQRQYVARVRQELVALPYPQNGESDREAIALRQVHDGLTRAMGKILPEADAVGVFYEAYVSTGRPGGISRFLQIVEAARVCGPATARTLETLYRDVSMLDQSAREELGEWQGDEWPSLESMIVRLLPCCGPEGFRVLCGLDWEASPAAILAMGAVGTPEARDILKSLYEQTLSEQHSRDLVVLRALTIAQRHAPDEATRTLIRRELTPLLHLPEDMLLLETCATAACIAAISRDCEFLKPLRQLLSEFEQASSSDSITPSVSEGALQLRRRSVEESLQQLETAVRLLPLDRTAP
ncbi:MAG: hypothetical protein IT364_21840 [Candidatus Hydrogenedentes bacterium]|nr:hypothetical protein [Candidatus Hydrogenedentota bacterium]